MITKEFSNTSSTTLENEDISLDETCGCQIGCGIHGKRIRTPSFQCFATTKGALVFISMAAFIQGFIVNGHTNVVISTLEKRFQLSSTESGLISSCYDIASSFTILFVTYRGSHGHKPQWVGWGTFFIGVAGIIFSLPHFTAPAYIYFEKNNTCGNPDLKTCEITTLQNFRFVFYLALLLAGAGASPLYSLGITYLDENVKQRYSSWYNGIMVAFSVIGPGAGFVVGGAFLGIYTNPDANITSLDKTSEQWVGAWWVGALLFGFLGLFASVPILMLPKVIPGSRKYKENREKEMYDDQQAIASAEIKDFGKKWKDFPRCLKVLIRNPTFMLVSIGGGIDSLLVGGLATFGSKYIETVFNIDVDTSGIYFGLLAILGGTCGILLGGGLITKFNLNMVQMLRITYITPIVAAICSAAFLITCNEPKFAGITISYSSQSFNAGTLYASCNLGCNCSQEIYKPVCGTDNIIYFSPCFAGCLVKEGNSFKNCSCITVAPHNAIQGSCTDNSCGTGTLFIVFMVVVFLLITLTFLNEAPALQVTLRTVGFNQRSFAIGLQWLLIRLLGTIPGPLVLGAIFDLACSRWTQECDTKGSCLTYNKTNLSKFIFIFIIVGKVVNFVVYWLAAMYYHPRPDTESPVSTNDGSVAKNSDTTEPISHADIRPVLPGEVKSPKNVIHAKSGFFDNVAFDVESISY